MLLALHYSNKGHVSHCDRAFISIVRTAEFIKKLLQHTHRYAASHNKQIIQVVTISNTPR